MVIEPGIILGKRRSLAGLHAEYIIGAVATYTFPLMEENIFPTIGVVEYDFAIDGKE
jgi:hypothetical protein